MADTNKIPQRSEIPVEHTWNTADIYPTDEAWEKEFDETQALARTLPSYAGRLGESAKTLYEYLTLAWQVSDQLMKLYNYAALRQDEDTRVAQYQAMAGKAMSLFVEVNSATAFETPELLKLPAETLERFYADEPGLELYRRYFTVIQDKKEHILSDAEEKLLAAAGEMAQAPDEIYSKFTNADLTFPDAVDKDGNALPLSQATFVPYEMSEDRELRRSAYEQFYDTCGHFQNTAAAVLSAEVKQRQFFATARKYESPLAAAVSSTRVPPEVYHNLVDTLNANLDKLHRYVT
ncbi:MAG: oligoendopeptidase F, partial [Oscillospiraceae bacterium]|nr:oligoendopeptidase F [Oscillospiraceae bacterium]